VPLIQNCIDEINCKTLRRDPVTVITPPNLFVQNSSLNPVSGKTLKGRLLLSASFSGVAACALFRDHVLAQQMKKQM
jgi:hypothetical protein